MRVLPSPGSGRKRGSSSTVPRSRPKILVHFESENPPWIAPKWGAAHDGFPCGRFILPAQWRHAVALLGRRQLHLLLGLERLLLLPFVENELIAPRRDFAELAHHGAGSGRDQPPDDDVLLKAVQRIDLAVDRRLGENPGGLLERCRRNERAGLERGLGDAEEHRIA